MSSGKTLRNDISFSVITNLAYLTTLCNLHRHCIKLFETLETVFERAFIFAVLAFARDTTKLIQANRARFGRVSRVK